VTKYVATTSTEPLTWVNSVALHDVPTELKALKQTDGPNLLTQGSSVLLQTLLEHDLIDEFQLMIFPLVLGLGKRLFGRGTKPGALRLTASAVSTTGVILNRYERAGAIKPGSFQQANPSDAEVARQARMQREG
jgi:dihydrofolate reductase